MEGTNSTSADISDLGKEERQFFWKGKEKVKKFEWFISGNVVSYDDLCEQNIYSGDTDESKLSFCVNILKGHGDEYVPVVYYPKNKIQKRQVK